MTDRKRSMYVITLVVITLISVLFLSFNFDVSPRSLAKRLLPSLASSAPPAVASKDRPVSRAPLALKPPQPSSLSVLTSERVVRNEKSLTR